MRLVLSFLLFTSMFHYAHGYAQAETVRIYTLGSDGSVGNIDSNWDVMQGAINGSDAYYDGLDSNRAFVFTHNGQYRALRSLMAFDTSVLPANSEITSAKLGLYVNTTHNSDNDSYAYVNVYEGLQASVNSLTTEDFSKCGNSIDNPSPGAEPIDIDNITINEFLEFQLNSTGLSWIDEDGYTQLCVREGHDVEDQPVDGSTFDYSGIRWDSVEKSVGTTTVAYLEITYTEVTEDPEREGLYTQIESPYPSEAETSEWEDDEYAWGDEYWCGSTIAGCGCAITSLVMLGRDNGIETGVDGEDLNPASLNNWLKQSSGYDGSGNVFWSKVADYFGSENNGVIETPLKVLNHKVLDRDSIEGYVEGSDTSVIGFSDTKGHFFYLSEVLGDGFEILDPLWYDTLTTDDEKDIANNVQDYNDVVNRGVVFELVDSSPQTGVIEATVDSPTELLLVNDDGKRSGYTEDGVLEEVTGSGYVQDELLASSDIDVSDEEGTNRILSVGQSGLYELYVIGTEAGEYLLSLLIKDEAGGETYFEHQGDTTPGQIEVFAIDLETGEIGLKPVDRTLFLLATARATDEDTDQVRRFFERWGNKIFDEIDGGKIKQAAQHLTTFGKLQKAKKVFDGWLDDLRSRLEEDLDEEAS